MEMARQTILIGLLAADVDKKATVSDAEIQAEYDKIKAQSGGTEYRARHILVEKEDDAKALIAQIKGGAEFEDLAKANSRIRDRARTAATSTSPNRAPTCPISRRR